MCSKLKKIVPVNFIDWQGRHVIKDVGEEKHVLFELILISCIESQFSCVYHTHADRWEMEWYDNDLCMMSLITYSHIWRPRFGITKEYLLPRSLVTCYDIDVYLVLYFN